LAGGPPNAAGDLFRLSYGGSLFTRSELLLLRHLLSVFAIVAAPLLLAHPELLLLELLLVEGRVESGLGLYLLGLLGGGA